MSTSNCHYFCQFNIVYYIHLNINYVVSMEGVMFAYLLSYCLQNVLYLFLYFENSSFPKPLSPKEEQEYFIQFFEGSASARDKIISHNLRLVAHVSKKYYTNAQDLEDFISIGTIGLIKAVNTYKLEKGRFSTYAARCIEN